MRAAKSILSHTQLSQLETNLGSPTVWSPVKTNAQDDEGQHREWCGHQGQVWSLCRKARRVTRAGGGAAGSGEVTALLVQTVSQGRAVLITRVTSCGVELGGTGIPNKSARHRTGETFESWTLLSYLFLQRLLVCRSPERAFFSCTVCGQQWLWLLSLAIAALGPIHRQGRCEVPCFGAGEHGLCPSIPMSFGIAFVRT